jgi:hypothetical protein
MEETLDSVDNDDELEEEADAEVDKVLFELTDGKLGQAGKVGSELPVSLLQIYISTLHHKLMTRHRKKTRTRAKKRRQGCVARCKSCSVGSWSAARLCCEVHRWDRRFCNTMYHIYELYWPFHLTLKLPCLIRLSAWPIAPYRQSHPTSHYHYTHSFLLTAVASILPPL